jgi:hypothetical protein
MTDTTGNFGWIAWHLTTVSAYVVNSWEFAEVGA